MSDLKRALLARARALESNPDQFAGLFRSHGAGGSPLASAVAGALADEFRALAEELRDDGGVPC